MSKQVQAQKFTLSGSGVSASATSISLVTLATPDGTAITMTDFGSDVGYATLEPGTTREESISFTGITSTTLTGVSRGLRFVSPFDVVAGNKKAHAGGTILVFSNTSAFYSRFVDDFNAQTIAGIKTFSSIPVLPASNPTTDNQAARKAYVDTMVPLAGGTMTGALILNTSAPSTDLQAASKGYVDGVAIAGAPDASTTVKGIVEEATQAEIIAGTGTGSTGARLFVNPTAVAETGTDKIVKTKSTGLLDPSIIPPIYNFGDGSDGDVTISSPTTLTRDMYYNNLTVTSTLTTNGYKIFVAGTIDGAGTIDWGTASAGSVGGNGISGNVGGGGSGGASSGAGQFVSTAGSNGGTGTSGASGVAGTAGVAKTSAIGGNGSAGGAGGGQNGGTGGTGGSAGSASIQTKVGIYANTTLLGVDFKIDGTFIPYQVSGGSGGGGGGADNYSGNYSGGGGGGGASGGIVYICASVWAGTFTIKSVGGAGGAGGQAYSGGSGDGGGGGGGRGGSTIVIYATKTWSGSYNIAGGAGGAGGASSGTNGTAGGTGTSYEILMSSLTR